MTRIIGIAAVWLAAGAAQAAGITVTVDRNQASVNEQLRLTVTVEGSQLTNPELPDLSPFTVHSAGTSRQFRIVNGAATSSVDLTYILVPTRPGVFTIGKARVEVDGRIYESKPFQVKIVAANAAPGPEQSDIFITARVSNRSPFVGEQVIFTLRFHYRLRLTEADADIPTFEGFLAEELGEQREYKSVIGGKEYQVTELRRALFPQEVGAVTIAPAKLTAEVVAQRSTRGFFMDPFFSGGHRTQTMVVRSNAVDLEVRPLPAEPPTYSGLVGKFAITAQVSKQEIKVGESTTLTLTVTGTGNVRMIAEPKLSGLEVFKVYADKPEGRVDTSGSDIRGSKTFRQALVPLAEGEVTIPSVPLVFFNPESGSYQTSRTRPITLMVGPADNPEELKLTELIGSTGGKVAVRVIADDIRPAYTGLDALSSQQLTPDGILTWGGGLVAPPFVTLGLAWVRRRREREASDSTLRRRRRALGIGTKALAGLRKKDGTEAVVEASRILRCFLGDALGCEGLALTPGEAAAQLEAIGIDEALVHEVRTILGLWEKAQYGVATLGAEDLSVIPAKLKEMMIRLDKRLPRRSAA